MKNVIEEFEFFDKDIPEFQDYKAELHQSNVFERIYYQNGQV
jgi:hypothetical protein